MPTYTHQEILDRMSLEEKVAFCSGATFWNTKSFENLGIPSIMMTDGPHGIRRIIDGGHKPRARLTAPATCFPPACATACSWDRELLQEMGAAIGEEALQEGVSIVLGPGVNIKRNPLCGRNFEYFSEDPYLAGVMAEYWIKGVQNKGVGVSLKHFAVNNQENYRTSSNSIVDERTLREIYLPAFEHAVKNARPATVMCAYNKLNGIYCSDNAFLLGEILRDEWGFEGVVISDWGAVNDRVEGFKAGMDLEMPTSGGFHDQAVIEAVRNGNLPEERINDSVDRLLQLVFSYIKKREESFRYEVDTHHDLARKIAAQSAILLKNEAPLLPIDRQRNIALIGALARAPRFQGAGSSWINHTRLSSAIDGFKAEGLRYTYFPGYPLKGPLDERLLQEAVEGASQCEVAVVFAGLPPIYEAEGFDRVNMKLPAEQDELIARVAEVNPGTVVVLSAGAPVEMPWLQSVKAVLHMYLPGQAGGLAAAQILTGVVNPSGKLAESHPITYEDVPSAGFYEQGERQAEYREGIYVGYRYYEKAGKEVCFPFGHGLSYTTFDYRGLRIQPSDISEHFEVQVSFTLKNTGKVAGAEVAQVYVGAIGSPVFRPEKELKQFTKVFLKAGESRQVNLSLDSRAFAFYDRQENNWVVAEGKYRISAGSSSRDIRLMGEVVVRGTQVQEDEPIQTDWYHVLKGKPSRKDLAGLLGHTIEVQPKPRKGEYTLYSSLQDMHESLAARWMLKLLKRLVAREFGGADETDPNFKGIIEFISTNPIRYLVASSGGILSLKVAKSLVEIANGKWLRGLISLLKKSR